MPFKRRHAVAFTLACLLAAVPAASAAPDSPQVGKRQWIDCSSGHMRGVAPYSVWPELWQAQREGRSGDVALLERIAHVPQAKWLAGKSVRQDPFRIVRNYVSSMMATAWGGPNCQTRYSGHAGADDPYVGDYPVFAIRQLEHEACDRDYDGGGPWNRPRNGSYLPWIEKFIAAIGPIGHEATVILEPDGLPVIGKCLSPRAAKQRLALMRAVARRLGSFPNLATYIDIGSSRWLDRRHAIKLLRRSGVRHVRGFALNTTHFYYTHEQVEYGDAIARRLGKRYVVNTAENGRGGLRIENPNARNIKDRFCNPRNAGLGPLPTTRTASRLADAYLWISRPGLSSNGHSGMRQCSRGPGGNVFWLPKAEQEARLASFNGQPPWPPAPL
ncbi:MAG TPA: glycoside hydrolase family 6 protein [Thermoleophilaceae bacterium]|nr:glycoside hydrolase family 6 protein [Thermoleophilaceae bacterium]